MSIGAPFLKPIAEAFERLGKWLTDRVKKVDLLDEASRMFPVISFYNESVSFWIDEVQKGALRPGEHPGIGDRLAAAGNAFVEGLKLAPAAYENEMILPRFLDAASAGLGAIAASMDRFAKPTEDMFDPRLRTASDLFGEAALAFRALQSSKEQARTFLFDQVLPAYKEFSKGSGKGKEASLETPEMLDGITRYIGGALMLLPQLPEFLAGLWKSLDLYVRVTSIEKFAEMEKQVYGLRATLIDLIYVRLRKMLQTAASFVDVASFILMIQAKFWLDFARMLGLRLLKDLARTGNDITKYVHDLIAWIEDKFFVQWSRILNFDLTPVIMAILGGVPGIVLSAIAKPPSVTLLDLIHAAGRKLLVDWINDVAGVLSLSPLADLLDIPDRLQALARVVGLVFSPLGHRKFATPLPIVPKAFPSIFDMWFKNAPASQLQSTLANISASLPNQLSEVIDTAAGAIETASYKFDDMAKAAAQGGSLAEYTAIVGNAAEQAARVFGPDVDALRKKVAEGKNNVVARSFESSLATGGFFTVGSVLGQYVFEMLDTFRKKEKTNDDVTVLVTGTSPSIIAKKAALSRVRMNRLIIDAHGRRQDDTLVSEIATSFREAIQTAFKTGVQEIRLAAETVKV